MEQRNAAINSFLTGNFLLENSFIQSILFYDAPVRYVDIQFDRLFFRNRFAQTPVNGVDNQPLK